MKGGDVVKALSIRNPFAWDIVFGDKSLEFRSWFTSYRGDFVICSSKSPKVKGTICGYALGVVKLDSITQITSKNYSDFGIEEVYEGEKLYAWKLENPRIIKPFAVKGKLNFFEIDDKLIEYLDGDYPQEKVDEMINTYFIPLVIPM